jgi:hypothetical protein
VVARLAPELGEVERVARDLEADEHAGGARMVQQCIGLQAPGHRERGGVEKRVGKAVETAQRFRRDTEAPGEDAVVCVGEEAGDEHDGKRRGRVRRPAA